MVISLDHRHPAHQVLKNFIKDCGFGEPISGCLDCMTFQPKVALDCSSQSLTRAQISMKLGMQLGWLPKI